MTEEYASEDVQRFAIQVEKRLCQLLDWQWQPTGMSIETLTLEIAKRMAAPTQEPDWYDVTDTEGKTHRIAFPDHSSTIQNCSVTDNMKNDAAAQIAELRNAALSDRHYMKVANEQIAKLQAAIEEQRQTIVALNSIIGGEGSLTTDNIVHVSRLEEQIAKLESAALKPMSDEEVLEIAVSVWHKADMYVGPNTLNVIAFARALGVRHE